MEDTVKQSKDTRQLNVEEVTIGNTTYVVKSNANSVQKAFVKKTVQKMLFNDLKQKIQKTYGQHAVKCKSKCKKAERNVAITPAQTTEKGKKCCNKFCMKRGIIKMTEMPEKRNHEISTS